MNVIACVAVICTSPVNVHQNLQSLAGMAWTDSIAQSRRSLQTIDTTAERFSCNIHSMMGTCHSYITLHVSTSHESTPSNPCVNLHVKTRPERGVNAQSTVVQLYSS